jgi:hypothetical protein
MAGGAPSTDDTSTVTLAPLAISIKPSSATDSATRLASPGHRFSAARG